MRLFRVRWETTRLKIIDLLDFGRHTSDIAADLNCFSYLKLSDRPRENQNFERATKMKKKVSGNFQICNSCSYPKKRLCFRR